MEKENYKKEFDKWNIQKKITHNSENKKTFHEQEIWFIKIGENIGFEQDGKGEDFLRPVIVYKKFSKNVFLGIPLTKAIKENKFYKVFDFHGEKSNAILSQIRLFDSKRLKYKIGKMSSVDFASVKEKLIQLIR
ncbi:MAG: type II toxin-antitoxin system PemK/MazF family toxin [Patescibacteria group bacterium]|nr:type II toxin-antitoxin system PemK/MazF family toxin [Patescibacteria group bacterium]